MKQNTSSDGINIIVTFTNEGEFERATANFYPSVAEVQKMYSDWEIVTITTKTAKTKSGKIQERVFLVARKTI